MVSNKTAATVDKPYKCPITFLSNGAKVFSLLVHFAALDHTDVGRQPRPKKSLDWTSWVIENEEVTEEEGEKRIWNLNQTVPILMCKSEITSLKKEKEKIDELLFLVKADGE